MKNIISWLKEFSLFLRNIFFLVSKIEVKINTTSTLLILMILGFTSTSIHASDNCAINKFTNDTVWSCVTNGSNGVLGGTDVFRTARERYHLQLQEIGITDFLQKNDFTTGRINNDRY